MSSQKIMSLVFILSSAFPSENFRCQSIWVGDSYRSSVFGCLRSFLCVFSFGSPSQKSAFPCQKTCFLTVYPSMCETRNRHAVNSCVLPLGKAACSLPSRRRESAMSLSHTIEGNVLQLDNRIKTSSIAISKK